MAWNYLFIDKSNAEIPDTVVEADSLMEALREVDDCIFDSDEVFDQGNFIIEKVEDTENLNGLNVYDIYVCGSLSWRAFFLGWSGCLQVAPVQQNAEEKEMPQ